MEGGVDVCSGTSQATTESGGGVMSSGEPHMNVSQRWSGGAVEQRKPEEVEEEEGWEEKSRQRNVDRDDGGG